MTVPKLLLVIAACLLIAFPASAQVDRRTTHEFLSICASDAANPEVIKDFLDRGVDVDLKDRSDDTALLLCARRGDVEPCVFLLEQGADVNVADSNGKPALAFARVLGLPVLERALLEAGARESLATVCRYLMPPEKASRIVQALIEAGADVDARTNVDAEGAGGATPLLLATAGFGQDLVSVRMLIDAGADVNARVTGDLFRLDKGQTAIFLSIISQNQELLPLLIELGADVNLQDHEGLTPLDVAMGRGDWVEQPWAAELLRAAGAKEGAGSASSKG